MKKKADTRERLHLLVPQKTKAMLDDLQERTGAGSMTEVIRRALALYDVVSQEMEKGKELVVRDPEDDGSKESETRIRFL